MKIVCIGGGPASLYFSLLAKKAHPDWDVTIYERNPADVTWGFGVVFSDETMDGFKDADEPTYTAITDSFVHWDDIDIYFKGEKITSGGHGFAGMQRLRLLQIIEARARELGVVIEHDREITSMDQIPEADLIVAGDGIASFIRDAHADAFETDVVMRPNKFVWLGTTKKFDAFTFYFNEDRHGLWRAHCYQYMPGTSTFIVECTEDTWRHAGLDTATEADTLAYCEKVFAEELGEDRLVSNNSVWRTFPRVKNGKYFHDNIVLLGDALHTAHFSIGSGTKLAMEDAIALSDALNAHAALPDALAAFQAERQPVVDSLQRAAQVSMEWFEEVERYHRTLEPMQFAYSLLTRSLRINHDNLRLRDPGYIDRVEHWYAERAFAAAGRAKPTINKTPPPIFTPFRLRDMTLENRIVLSPMCMYSATEGLVNDWHLVHLGSRAVGGAGLIYTEMTAVSAEARITPGCAGIYSDEHVTAWRRINDFIHANSVAKTCMQLGHSGRKGSTKLLWEGADRPLDSGNWEVMAPSPEPYAEGCHVPREMHRSDMEAVIEDYVAAARRADAAGFDMLEVHFAHGYLLSTFLSPLTNFRGDAFGGPIENRMRFPMEVFEAVRAAWPAGKPMAVRISATDWKEGGFSHTDGLALVEALEAAGCDIIDVSAGQVVSDQRPRYGRLFQTPFSTRLRLDTGMATMTVGNIQSFGDANAIIAGGRADLCVLARMHLADPYWTRHAAYEYDWPMPWPPQYQSVQVYTPRWS
ncbi:MAG: bifunctional salicylyl-CoA 5-hydroxylase/oxidoreductase [Hyphomicrobiales bacterium]|nr:bifunctional salicylyl-CoA 5-hydroxylase/oxidoreductase [Hyphomicrobiales bacterium]MCP5372975.1 bifunctional salicylyl-CoA 5-hydroxylase/oxidoreductase [Hyphomicrobiales bacterium]